MKFWESNEDAEPGALATNEDVEPRQTVAVVDGVTVIVGAELTVTTVVADPLPQALLKVYDIVVVPRDSAVIIPEVPMVPTANVEEDQTPPEIPFVSVAVVPTHNEVVPDIVPVAGKPFTVTIVIADPPLTL